MYCVSLDNTCSFIKKYLCMLYDEMKLKKYVKALNTYHFILVPKQSICMPNNFILVSCNN